MMTKMMDCMRPMKEMFCIRKYGDDNSRWETKGLMTMNTLARAAAEAEDGKKSKR